MAAAATASALVFQSRWYAPPNPDLSQGVQNRIESRDAREGARDPIIIGR